MKKIALISGFLFIAAVMLCFADNDTVTRDSSRLPKTSREFISTHFSQLGISHIKIEKNLLGTKGYDVILTDGTDIEFDSSGEWTEIDGHQNPLPLAIVPQVVSSYVVTHFADKEVVSMEKERRGWSVKLNNGMELTFNKEGVLVDIDD